MVTCDGSSVWLPKTPKAAIMYYRDLHSADVSSDVLFEAKRLACRNDLFYLMVYLLNRRDILHPWLFERCREVQAAPDGYIDLWAREHRKSTLITFGKTIQDILNDPEITVGLFSHTRPIAKSFLGQIKREFETNQPLKELFPDVLYEEPAKQAQTWSLDGGLVVKRQGNPKETTLSASGLVDGQPTGMHFKLRVYDDVVTRESVTTREQIDKTTEAWELSDNLGMEGGAVRMIGTRYHLADTYSTVISRKAAITRIHPATANGRMDGRPVLFTPEEWERRKRTQSRSMIAAQLLQNPLADEDAIFNILWLKSYEVRPRTMNVFIMCDPSKGRSARSDNTAIAVIGVSGTGGRYLLDGYCHRMTLSQRWVALRELHKLWSAMPGVQHIEVGYERYGQQSDDEYFKERMEHEDYYFDLIELNWTFEGTRGEQGKRTRVERMEPDFRNGRFYLPLAVWHNSQPCTWYVDANPESKSFQTVQYKEVQGFTRAQKTALEGGSPELIAKAIKRYDEERKAYDLSERLINEYLTFPFGEHDDLMDACSRIYDLEPRAPVFINQSMTEPPLYYDS